MTDDVERMLALLDENFPPVHEMTGAAARAAVAARAVPADNLDDVASAEDVLVDGTLRLRVYRPHRAAATPAPVVVFLHGGGFVFCSIESHDGFCRRLSRHTGSVVVSVDYRLAPEHRAPAAAEDAWTAVAWVAREAVDLGVDPDRLVIAGDSAGGNLAAVACLLARDRGGPAIAGQVLLYPVLEPDFESESYQRYGSGHFNTRAAMEWYWAQYLGGTEVPEPAAYVTPLRSPSLADLPPAVMVTAGRDPLCSEGKAYVDALRAVGVPVRHRHYPDLFHGFATMAGFGAGASARELLWSDLAGLLGARLVKEPV